MGLLYAGLPSIAITDTASQYLVMLSRYGQWMTAGETIRGRINYDEGMRSRRDRIPEEYYYYPGYSSYLYTLLSKSALARQRGCANAKK